MQFGMRIFMNETALKAGIKPKYRPRLHFCVVRNKLSVVYTLCLQLSLSVRHTWAAACGDMRKYNI